MDGWGSSRTFAGEFRRSIVSEQLPSFDPSGSIYANGGHCAVRTSMPELIQKSTIVAAEGNLPKRIAEYVGRVNSATEAVSIARMESPAGWREPGQTPEFDEYTVVLRGLLRVETRSGAMDVNAGQAVIARRGEWVRYSSPAPGGAEYIAVCIPAFSAELVHRDNVKDRGSIQAS